MGSEKGAETHKKKSDEKAKAKKDEEEYSDDDEDEESGDGKDDSKENGKEHSAENGKAPALNGHADKQDDEDKPKPLPDGKKVCSDCGEMFPSDKLKEHTLGGKYKRMLCTGCIDEL